MNHEISHIGFHSSSLEPWPDHRMRHLVLIGSGSEARVVCNMMPQSGFCVYIVDPMVGDHLHPDLKDRVNVKTIGDGNRVTFIGHISYLREVIPTKTRKIVRAILDLDVWLSALERVHGLVGDVSECVASVIAENTTILGSVEGSVIHHGVHIGIGASVSHGCIINTGAIIEHEVHIGNSCFVGPGAIVCGGAIIRPRSFIGAGAKIRPGVTIGSGAFVEMGAIVTKDVPAKARVRHARSTTYDADSA